jgi:hypothetical protein
VDGGDAGGAGRDSPDEQGPAASTGCLVAVIVAAVLVLVAAPVLLWGAGMACG